MTDEAKPPSSLLAKVFEQEPGQYWLILEALWEGLQEFEAQIGDSNHANTLPAA